MLPDSAELGPKIDFLNLKYMSARCIDTKRISLQYSSIPMPLADFKINEKYAVFPVASDKLGWILIDGSTESTDENLPLESVLECSSQIRCFALDPYNPNRVAAGVCAGRIEIFGLPSGKKLQIIQVKDSCSNTIVDLSFHTFAQDIICACSGKSFLVWKLNGNDSSVEEAPAIKLNPSIDCLIQSFQWNKFKYAGIFIAAIGLDPEKPDHYELLVFDWRKTHENATIFREFLGKLIDASVCWAIEDRVLLVSLSKLQVNPIIVYNLCELTLDFVWVRSSGKREVRFYRFDESNRKPVDFLKTYDIDDFGRCLLPHFDEDMKVLYLTSRGSPEIRVLFLDFPKNEPDSELVVEPAYDQVHFINDNCEVIGFDFWPRFKLNVKEMEIAVGFGLLAKCEKLIKFNFTTPRAHAEYFHEEIYPPSFLFTRACLTSDSWLKCFKDGNFESLTKVKRFTMNLKPEEMLSYEANKTRLQQITWEKNEKRREELNKSSRRIDQSIQDTMDLLYRIDLEDKKEETTEGVDSLEWISDNEANP